MYYIPYMILKSQLLDQNRAKLIIEGVEVYFEISPSKNRWIIKANMYFYAEELSSSLQETIQSLDFVKIQKVGAALKAFPEEGFVVFSKETHPIEGFLSFKDAMKSFMETFDFWKSVVDDLVKSEGALTI